MHYNLVERKHEPSGFLRTVGVAMAQFPRFDLVISNGRLCDPAGGAKRRADTAKGLYVTPSLVDVYPTAAHSGTTTSRMQEASASLADWRIPEVHSRAGNPEIDPVNYWSFMKRTGKTVVSTRRGGSFPLTESTGTQYKQRSRLPVSSQSSVEGE
jgi:hypothetical protein